MVDLELILDFACCCCKEPVSVTVKCTGDPLALSEQDSSSVSVPCPGCSKVNKLTFEPNGTVRTVTTHAMLWPLPEPSLN